MKDIVQETWDEVGCKIRARGCQVFLRTDPPVESENGILFPAEVAKFYGGLMHLRLVTATVLSAGPFAQLEPGMKICFQRKYLAKWRGLKDGTFIGWVDANQVTGEIGPGTKISPFLEQPGGPKQVIDRPL